MLHHISLINEMFFLFNIHILGNLEFNLIYSLYLLNTIDKFILVFQIIVIIIFKIYY